MIHIHWYKKVYPAAWKHAKESDKCYKKCRCGDMKEYELVSY